MYYKSISYISANTKKCQKFNSIGHQAVKVYFWNKYNKKRAR